MKPWDRLTDAGRYRRMRTVAGSALEAWPLTIRRMRLVGGFTNVIYRIDADEGTYALRVDLMQDHQPEDTVVEVAWLLALADTDIDAVRPVPTADGRPLKIAVINGDRALAESNIGTAVSQQAQEEHGKA